MISNDILRNFSRSAEMYHSEASIQKASAQKLVSYLKPFQKTLVAGPCLEVGCGTGFVTKSALELFPKREWIISDFSEEMLDYCKNQIPPSDELHFELQDAEHLFAINKYSLVISGMTIQWFKHVLESVRKLFQAVKSGGILCLSFLESDSFMEWKAICQEIEVPFTGHILPSAHDIFQVLADLADEITIHREPVTARYDSTDHFFKHLKRIGASASSRSRLQPHEMLRLKQHWDQRSPQGIHVTYNIAYLIAEKMRM